MFVSRSIRRVLLGLPLAAVLCWPASAGEMAQVRQASDRLEWEPAALQGHYRLIVSGQGVRWDKLFADGGRGIAMPLFDPEGQALPDGVYKWELTAMPAPIAGKWHDPANGRDGGRPLAERPDPGPRVKREVGWFHVIGGSVVLPGAVEPPQGKKARAGGDQTTSGPAQ